MKLHEVHFCSQVLRSRGAAEAEENLTAKVHLVQFHLKSAEENLTEKCTECNFIPMSTRWQPSSPSRRRGLLGCLRVDIGTESVSHPPFSVLLFVSTPGSSCSIKKMYTTKLTSLITFFKRHCHARTRR